MANEKHIFIGLGGSGCQTIAQIKEKVYANKFRNHTATKSRIDAMNENYRFLFIDTDQRDIDRANNNNRKSFEDGRIPFVNPQSDLVNLGQANPQAIYYEADKKQDTLINKRILEACSPELAVKMPDQPLSFGAGAFRIKSRIAFAHSLTDFQTKLQAAISSLNDVKNVGGASCTIFYWVICSTNGGTGSGIINDVLYHINQIHKQVVGDGDPQLILTMYMPKIYIDCNATEDKYALNAYAVFKEIGSFKEMSLSPTQNTVMHRMAFINDYNLINSKRRYCPFYYLIPIDIQTDKGTSLGNTDVMYRNTAEMLYILHEGAGGNAFRSDIDNYMNDIMERNHENFLVPMGYVQLHKPTVQFDSYFRARFERDLLRTWLLNADDKANQIPDNKVFELYNTMFKQLNEFNGESLAFKFRRQLNDFLEVDLSAEVLSEKEELPSQLYLDNINSDIESMVNTIAAETKAPEKKAQNKERIHNEIWRQAETWIKENGLIYAINATDVVRTYIKEQYDLLEANRQNLNNAADEKYDELRLLYEKANQRTLMERTISSNSTDLETYRSALAAYAEMVVNKAINEWKHDLLRDFCNNEKTDELAKLKNYLIMIKDQASEMNEAAVKHYDKLFTEFGNTALDVTTVYLPMLKEICDGNGWKSNNFFSRCYRNIIQAEEDKEETAVRKSLTQLLLEGIYNCQDEGVRDSLNARQYILTEKMEGKAKDNTIEECRIFANPKLNDRKPEAIIEDFIAFAQKRLEKLVKENSKIQEDWHIKKVSHFFNDLPNEQKDEVRRSLNPSLFFSYNTNRIEVTKKEEHLVFVAPDRDLAKEMLGYEEGNVRHRFVSNSDVNSALVLKSKYGLSFQDYRIYDSLEMVYNKASFREKYHFHHDFAQFLDRITLENLPDEILPQHITFAKMLMLKEFEPYLNPLMYKDEYDPDAFESSMYLVPDGKNTYFEIARPEAISVRDGYLCITKMENGRKLFDEISGISFDKRFEQYFELFYNHRYGETLNNIMLNLLKLSIVPYDENNNLLLDKEGNAIKYNGEEILKKNYEECKKSLLQKLTVLKQQSPTEEEKRLYSIFFNIVRKEFDTVHKFIG